MLEHDIIAVENNPFFSDAREKMLKHLPDLAGLVGDMSYKACVNDFIKSRDDADELLEISRSLENWERTSLHFYNTKLGEAKGFFLDTIKSKEGLMDIILEGLKYAWSGPSAEDMNRPADMMVGLRKANFINEGEKKLVAMHLLYHAVNDYLHLAAEWDAIKGHK